MAVMATGLPSVPGLTDQSGDGEVHPRGNESSKRSGEGESGGAHRSVVLLRQPKAEDSEVAAKEAEEEQHRDKRLETLREVECPAKTKRMAMAMPAK